MTGEPLCIPATEHVTLAILNGALAILNFALTAWTWVQLRKIRRLQALP